MWRSAVARLSLVAAAGRSPRATCNQIILVTTVRYYLYFPIFLKTYSVIILHRLYFIVASFVNKISLYRTLNYLPTTPYFSNYLRCFCRVKYGHTNENSIMQNLTEV